MQFLNNILPRSSKNPKKCLAKMSRDNSEDKTDYILKTVDGSLDRLEKELKELFLFRDLYFENHPIEMAEEKSKLVEQKKEKLLEKFDTIDVEEHIPFEKRAQFLYMKGRCYNVSTTYDARATQCLSKAVKLNPNLVEAWNELGECYWKNLNIKEAKASFEGAIKHERNCLSLRCLSIILRQESGGKSRADKTDAILKSVELAKEAVALDIKDGMSWSVLGNAYLCQFFTVLQDPATLKQCKTAYKQASLDPIAKGQPDLYYNKGIALKYEEFYDEALENFDYACRLDPSWQPPRTELNKLQHYLAGVNELVKTKGKTKAKKLKQMVQSIDKKMLGTYVPAAFNTIGSRSDVVVHRAAISSLSEGDNHGKVILGKVVGSIHNDDAVPFTFAIVDESMECSCVTVYNWANGCGVIIGDTVCVPEPRLRLQRNANDLAKYEFKSIRINTPTLLLINGKKVGRYQFASTLVSSTYELH